MPKPASEDLPDTEVEPDPALEKRTRRLFTTEYKLRIIAEADQCQHGELGPLLRREKLYHNQLQTWRRELASGGEQALGKSAPGPKLWRDNLDETRTSIKMRQRRRGGSDHPPNLLRLASVFCCSPLCPILIDAERQTASL